MDKTTRQALLAALSRTAPARPPRRAERLFAAILVGAQVFALGGCTWLSLSWGVFSYPTTQRGGYTFLEAGRYEVTFSTRVDGVSLRASRAIVVGDPQQQAPPNIPPTAPSGSGVKWL